MLKPILCLLLFTVSYEAIAQPELQLELSQQLDANCQGSELIATQTVEPGQCIRYQLKLTNLGSTATERVTLNLPVPQHTLLKQDLMVAAGNISLPAVQLLSTAQAASGEQVLQTQLDKLEAQQQVVLQYSVQVL